MFSRFLRATLNKTTQHLLAAPLDYRIRQRRDSWRAVKNYDAEVINLSEREGGAALVDLLAQLDLSGKTVADVGCGPGYFLPALAAADKIYAVDWAENLLAQARGRGPGQTTYLTSDIRQLQLPEPVDLVVCINALMPESHEDALGLLKKLLSLLKPDGILLLVVPSWESFLLGYNLVHFSASAGGDELVSQQLILKRFQEHFNNPFGYIRYTDETYRHWLHDELLLIPPLYYEAVVVSLFKVAIRWTDVLPHIRFADVTPPPWLWGVLVQNKAELGAPNTASESASETMATQWPLGDH
jgi:SAM-dependent methyltransferase